MELQLNQFCVGCNGVGIRRYNVGPNGPLTEENPCAECGGDGRSPASFRLEAPWFDTVTATLAAHTAELDYIHGKVTAIWNQVKPGH